jgi:hypothetical protein
LDLNIIELYPELVNLSIPLYNKVFNHYKIPSQ